MIFVAIGLALAGGASAFAAGSLWETDDRAWPAATAVAALLLAAALGCVSW